MVRRKQKGKRKGERVESKRDMETKETGHEIKVTSSQDEES